MRNDGARISVEFTRAGRGSTANAFGVNGVNGETVRGNRLLDSLPESEARTIFAHLRIVELRRGDTTTLQDRAMVNVDFPLTALMSVMGSLSDGAVCEVATVGSEAFVEIDAALASNIALRSATCQFDGQAARMSIINFQDALARRSVFSVLVHRAVRARMFLTEQMEMCNLRHTVVQRLARWLLVAGERLRRTEFSVTHELLAATLGVRRAAITGAIADLRQQGAVHNQRGTLEIDDVRTLVGRSCECYAVIREALAQALVPE